MQQQQQPNKMSSPADSCSTGSHDEESDIFGDDVADLSTRQHPEEEEECRAQSIARAESNFAQKWKVIVMVLLWITAAIVVVTSYMILVNQEKDGFESTVSIFQRRCI